MTKRYFKNRKFWALSIPIIVIVLVALLVVILSQSPPAAMVTISGQYDIAWITSITHTYCVQNNVWNPDSGWEQTLQVNNRTGVFTVNESNANNPATGSPVSYPSIYRGNHWGTATTNSGMPVQVADLSVYTSWSINIISSGIWDAAYDIWFHQTSDYKGGQPNGAELMIWLNYQDISPATGWHVDTTSLDSASWEVFYTIMMSGSTSWNYVAYQITSKDKATSLSFNINTFVADAVSRGYIQNSWYLISVEAGFELWQGGRGLKSNSFSVSVG